MEAVGDCGLWGVKIDGGVKDVVKGGDGEVEWNWVL